MSHAKPQPDIKYFKDYLSMRGKKSIDNQEFFRRKLERIASKIADIDWVQGQLAKANIEIYFNNYSNADQIFENALKVTDNQSIAVWDMYISFKVMTGEIDKLVDLMWRMLNLNLPQPKSLRANFLHVVQVYKLFEVFEDIFTSTSLEVNEQMRKDYEKIKKEATQIKSLNVSIETYRMVISQIYIEFYKNYIGSLTPTITIEDNEIVVRAGCTVDNAHDLFELNNLYRNKIMDLFANCNDDKQEEFDKISVYYKYYDFKGEFEGIHG